jgi:hypothetical protein
MVFLAGAFAALAVFAGAFAGFAAFVTRDTVFAAAFLAGALTAGFAVALRPPVARAEFLRAARIASGCALLPFAGLAFGGLPLGRPGRGPVPPAVVSSSLMFCNSLSAVMDRP